MATLSRRTNSFLSAGDATLARKSTNVTLAVGLVAEARELGVNVSQAAETGLAAAVAQSRQQRWLEENKDSMEGWNAYVEENGLPLSQYRGF